MKRTLAIFSPNRNQYSETFIQAHKKLDFNIKFYYGGWLPTALEMDNNILKLSFKERIKRKRLRGFGFEEKRILFSLRKENVDAVLAEYGPTACESLKMIKYLKLPLLVHFYGFDASEKDTLLKYGEKYKEVFDYAEKIMVVSNRMKQALISLHCPENKLVINYCGPDSSFFSLKPDFKQKIFASMGRFVNKKAPHLTIQAFKKVVEKYPDAKLIMAGDGDLLKICKALTKALNLNTNIIFTGILNREEEKLLFENALAFVQHSVVADNGDSEGTPVAILEAQAAGLPVISTYHAGIPEVVIHEETGLLVEEHDVDGMSKNMIRILEEDGLAKRLGDAGRMRVRKNFTTERHLRTLQREIEKAIVS